MVDEPFVTIRCRKMTTVEKLLAQIFERKKSIIEQVNQQTELYRQYLASKSLIDGITPPTWLWNPNTSDSEGISGKYPHYLYRCLL